MNYKPHLHLLLLILISGTYSLAQNHSCAQYLPDMMTNRGYLEFREYRDCMLRSGMDKSKEKRLRTVSYHTQWVKGIAFAGLDFGNQVFIDTAYNLIREADFDEFAYNNGNVIVAQKNKLFGIVNFNEDIITPFEYEDIRYCCKGLNIVSKNGQYGLINNKGQITVPVTYERLDYGIYNEAGVITAVKNGKYGLITTRNQVILPFEYDQIEICYDQVIVTRDRRMFLFNTKGQKLTNQSYDKINCLSRYCCKLVQENKSTMYNSKTMTVSPALFDNIRSTNNDQYFIAQIDTLEYLINSAGKVLTSKGYARLDYNDQTGLLEFGTGFQQCGYMDLREKIVIQPRYESLYPFYNGHAILGDADSVYFFDTNGRCFKAFAGEFESTQSNGDVYYINVYDKNGNRTSQVYYNIRTGYEINPGYNHIDNWTNRIILRSEESYCLTDEKGKVIVPFYKYNMIRPLEVSDRLLVSTISDVQGQRSGLIDYDGNVVLPFSYSYFEYYKKGIIKTMTTDGREQFIDHNLKFVSKPREY